MVDLAEIQAAYYMVAATGVIVAAFYYVMTLRTTQKNSEETLETRQAQLFMGFYDKFTSIEGAESLLAIQEWKVESLDDFMEMWNNRERNRIWGSIFMVFEGIGVLLHEELIEVRIVARYLGMYRFIWEKWGPYVKLARVLRKRPRMYVEAEYLYDKLMEFGRANPDYGIV